MSRHKEISKTQLLKVIDDLSAAPADRVRILGDLGITSLGAGLGAVAAGGLAAVAGATTIPAITTAASWLGVSVVAATPLGWVAGAALVGGALAYSVSRMIRSGGLSEGRKRELLQVYREQLQKIQRQEQSQEITELDRTQFITSLREVIEKDAISPKKAFQLIEAVEHGAIPLSRAYSLIGELLESKKS